MAVRHETELYAPLKVFFEKQGYQIKGEVRTCDLVGVREGEAQPLIVEMKKTFTLALLLQGIERLKISPQVYLAVERCRDKKGAVNQRWGELSGLCRRLGLGLMTVTFYKTKAPIVEVLVLPDEEMPRQRSGGRRRDRLLYEFHERSGDYNTGGSTRVKLVTAYREKALRVARALHEAEADAASAGKVGGHPSGPPGDGAAAGAAGAVGGGGAGAAEIGEAGAAGGGGAEAGPAFTDAADDAAALHAAARRESAAAGSTTRGSRAGSAGVTPAELRKRSGVPSAAQILQRNYYGWFLRVNRGRYTLTPLGQAALIEYAAVAAGGNSPR